ncbi:TraX family protein [Aerococcaceae bacterium WGS1372]
MDDLNHPSHTFLNSAQLKIIGMVTMLIDHIGAFVLLPWLQSGQAGFDFYRWELIYTTMRLIGRLAFPLFCFLIVEGFIHTSNVNRYMMRLGIFALISEIPFDLAKSGVILEGLHQNVMFTLLVGLLALWVIKHIQNLPLRILLVVACLLSAEFLHSDYRYLGVAVVIILYSLREFRLYQSVAGALAFTGSWFAMLAFILTYFYNGEKGKQNSKLFYIFYLVHLLILAFIAQLFIH